MIYIYILSIYYNIYILSIYISDMKCYVKQKVFKNLLYILSVHYFNHF